VVALAGCASSPEIASYLDPIAADHRYDGFLAYAAFTDLGLEARYENALCERLMSAGHACTTMLAAAPPTRDQDAASRHAATRASGAQATIVIELASPDSISRRLLADCAPGFEISVIDNANQQVVARVAIEITREAVDARRLAAAISRALAATGLFYQRS